MKRSFILAALVVLLAIGSYAIFAQQQQSASEPPPQYQQPMGPGMGPGMMQSGMAGRGMGRGMMQGRGPMGTPGCAGCRMAWGALAHESIVATSDGGVVVAVAGKLIKYDDSLQKVAETNVEVDWAQVHKRMEQIIQNCPWRRPRPRAVQPPSSTWQGQPNP